MTLSAAATLRVTLLSCTAQHEWESSDVQVQTGRRLSQSAILRPPDQFT